MRQCIIEQGRGQMFSGVSGVAIEMVRRAADHQRDVFEVVNGSELMSETALLIDIQTEQIYETPSLNGVMEDVLFLQNIPSIVVGHLLDPQPGATLRLQQS
jgi:hypothetical protein